MLEGKLSNNNIYKLQLQPSANPVKEQVFLTVKTLSSITLWHRRLTHLNVAYLKQLRLTATGIQFSHEELNKCEVCVTGQLVNKPFRANAKRTSRILELVRSDACLSIGQARYFITFLDDCSRKIFVYFLKKKDEVPATVGKFIKYVENQSGHKIKTLRTDNGREYANSSLNSTLDNLGIKHETSASYEPQQNGTVERVNRTLLEKSRCMLAESQLPTKFGAKAVSTASYLSNRSSKRCLEGCTPEELWAGVKPDLLHLRVFGCRVRDTYPITRGRRWIQPQDLV